uniref:F-ATPase gamma subunit n=1 Tax=Oryza brachyantha TaxID=4533 RepID=J3MK84_ORYBR
MSHSRHKRTDLAAFRLGIASPPKPDPKIFIPSECTIEVNDILITICDLVYSLFISKEVDKMELLYSKFVSLICSNPIIKILLPMSPKGEICDINDVCVDDTEHKLSCLTTKEGKHTI